MTDDPVLQARIELARRELARRKQIHFMTYVFPSYNVNAYNKLICDAVDLVVFEKISRLMIFIQPRAGKSEIVSRKLPARYLGLYPDREVILTSYAASLATTFSREARDLVSSDLYQNLFGVNALEIDEAVTISDTSKSVLNWRIANRRGGLLAAGVGGGITGQGANLAIIDDPIKDDSEAQSEKVRESLYDWYLSALRTRLFNIKKSGIILCMTRWSENDLAGMLLQNQYRVNELWHVLRIPALAETPEETKEYCERNFITPDRYLTPQRIDDILNDKDLQLDGR